MATSVALNSLSDARLIGVEVIDAGTASAGTTVNLSRQTESFAILGSAFADTIIGNDVLKGDIGFDTLNGSLGSRQTTGSSSLRQSSSAWQSRRAAFSWLPRSH
jgi:hypothetical protein